jgi:hypothetical protein
LCFLDHRDPCHEQPSRLHHRITAQHDALKPFAPENGQPLRFKIGDAVIYTNETAHSSGAASPVLPAHRAGLYARGARYSAGLVIAVDAGLESSLRPDDSA